MAFKLIAVSVLVISFSLWEVDAHGRLTEPMHRGGAWRKGFNTPKDYNDNANYCGGFGTQYYNNNGKCGVCGDDYAEPRPRNNENGGIYGTGTIVQRYTPGEEIELQVEITANHMGYFEFSVCPLNSTMDLETEECFDAHPIFLADGTLRYPLKADIVGLINIRAVLPANLICQHCVLRWHYYCGNNWGECRDGTGKLGCGIQETFRTCSDITIL